MGAGSGYNSDLTEQQWKNQYMADNAVDLKALEDKAIEDLKNIRLHAGHNVYDPNNERQYRLKARQKLVDDAYAEYLKNKKAQQKTQEKQKTQNRSQSDLIGWNQIAKAAGARESQKDSKGNWLDPSYDDAGILETFDQLGNVKTEVNRYQQDKIAGMTPRVMASMEAHLPEELRGENPNVELLELLRNPAGHEGYEGLSETEIIQKFREDKENKVISDNIDNGTLRDPDDIRRQKAKEAKEKKDAEKRRLEKEKKDKEFENKVLAGRKVDEFLKNNPNIFKMLGKNSGYSFADKLSALGELLASTGANWLKGVAKPGEATPIVGPIAQMLSDARKGNVERKSKNYDAEQETQATIARAVEKYKLDPDLKKYDQDALYAIHMAMSEKLLTRAEFENQFPLENATPEEMDKLYKAYTKHYKRDLDNVELRDQLREMNDRSYSSVISKMKDERDCEAAIQDLLDAKSALKEKLVEFTKKPYENFASTVNAILGTYRGISTTANNVERSLSRNQSDASSTNRQNNSSKTDFYEVSAGVKGGIPVVQAHVDTSGGTTWVEASQTGSSSSRNTGLNTSDSSGSSSNQDLIAMSKLPFAEKQGKLVMEATKESIDAVKACYEEQIKWIDDQIKALNEQKDWIKEQRQSSMNDGIAKAPHMRQWLVREDGSRIELNPNDNVYATLNELTTAKDDGSPVVHMDQQDRATVYRQRLGYGDGVKTKDFAYYRKLLGRG